MSKRPNAYRKLLDSLTAVIRGAKVKLITTALPTFVSDHPQHQRDILATDKTFTMGQPKSILTLPKTFGQKTWRSITRTNSHNL